MTREEAIEQLQNCKDLIKQDGQDYLDERDIPLLDMAIDALSDHSGEVTEMVDLISRQDAIDAIRNAEVMIAYDSEWSADVLVESVIEQTRDCGCANVKLLPSAEPKTGECSGCKFIGSYDTDFPCVNCVRKTKDYYCGARMRGEEE